MVKHKHTTSTCKVFFLDVMNWIIEVVTFYWFLQIYWTYCESYKNESFLFYDECFRSLQVADCNRYAFGEKSLWFGQLWMWMRPRDTLPVIGLHLDLDAAWCAGLCARERKREAACRCLVFRANAYLDIIWALKVWIALRAVNLYQIMNHLWHRLNFVLKSGRFRNVHDSIHSTQPWTRSTMARSGQRRLCQLKENREIWRQGINSDIQKHLFRLECFIVKLRTLEARCCSWTMRLTPFLIFKVRNKSRPPTHSISN